MTEISNAVINFPRDSEDPLLAVMREGARKLLTQALEMEVEDIVAKFASLRGPDGKRLVVRNGYMPERNIQTGIGDIPVKAPRVNDKRLDEEGRPMRFSSKLLPPYLRRTKSIEELIPWLYLKGVSTGNFTDALAALLGKDAPGLSASTVTRLKSVWQEEYQQWRKASFGNKRFVYIWADGIYFNIRLGEDQRICMLSPVSDPETELVHSLDHRGWGRGAGHLSLDGMIDPHLQLIRRIDEEAVNDRGPAIVRNPMLSNQVKAEI